MLVKYPTPKELMNGLLFREFKHNQYFKFGDFAQKVNAAQSHYPIDYDMMKDFIYEMIDQNKIAQEYVSDDQNPFLDESSSSSSSSVIEKSIHFKIIAEQQ